MKNSNVCFFIPKQNSVEGLRCVHFVHETSLQIIRNPKLLSTFHLYLIVEGKGVLHSRTHNTNLRAGDIFFGLPAVPFSLETSNDFSYIYISFFGKRANHLTDKLSINEKNCVFHGFYSLIGLWKNSLAIPEETAQLRSESLLLYTFSAISAKYYANKPAPSKQGIAELTKEYIEKHFTDPQLSLQKLSTELSYNPKYLSSVFKNTFHTGISDYITMKRLEYAFTLINQGVTIVKTLSTLCGFRDPLYFSKVFKTNTGVSPRDYLQNSP